MVRLDWVVADELYGRNGQFLDEMEELSQNYVVEVPVTTHVWTTDPALLVPAYSGRGRTPTRPADPGLVDFGQGGRGVLAHRGLADAPSGQGAKGPLVYDFAAVRVWPSGTAKRALRVGW